MPDRAQRQSPSPLLVPIVLVWLLSIAILPGRAEAVGMSIVRIESTGASTTRLSDGDVITFDLVVRNESNLEVVGVGLSAFGHDVNENNVADDALRLAGGLVSSTLFSEGVQSGPTPFGGLPNIRSAPRDTGTSPPGSFGTIPSGLSAVLFEGVSLTPSSGDGSLDLGIGGDLIANGDVHYRVSFVATAVGAPVEITLRFGPDPRRDIVVTPSGVAPFDYASHTLIVNPEPGPALLMALGLAGLARQRRGDTSR